MAINALQSTNSYAGTAPSMGSLSSDGTEDRFLKLLIAQMKNQDPLNPLDNAQVTSQMAQINTVQGISQLNATMATMLAQLQGSQAVSLPGHQVLIPGNTITIGAASGATTGVAGTAAPGAKAGFELNSDADRVGVDIKDASGTVVAHLDLGAQPAGPGSFSWDGTDGTNRLPAGKYTFEIKATNGSAAVGAATLRAARVEGTTLTMQGVRLSLEGQETRYYNEVRMVL